MANPVDNNSESLLPNLADPTALNAEIDRLRKDNEFMDIVHKIVEQDREILDRLADS